MATLDTHTSDICRNLDGKHYPMSEYKAGVTAPPFHVYCRSTTAPYFDDDFGQIGQRAARDENGKTYYVPDNMTYAEWQKAFINGDKSGLTNAENGGIMKMGKASPIQNPPDFTKYDVKQDVEAVEKIRNKLIKDLGILEQNVSFDGVLNSDVLEPFVNRLIKIKQETDLKLPNFLAVDVIEGDECCIASFKPFENTMYISRHFFNSKDALIDTLKEWARIGIMPKQCTTIEYIAEHEAAHILLPRDIITSEKAKKIFKQRKLLNENDVDIIEYFADIVAIYRTSKEPDANVIKAIEYLKERVIVL